MKYATRSWLDKQGNGIFCFKSWLLASRPQSLPAGAVPIIVGTALAQSVSGKINWFIALATIISALLIQIGINLINDGLDFKKGVDNEMRIGFKRMTQSGQFSFKQIMTAGFLCFGLALLIGIPLILQGGWPMLCVLLISVIFGYLYTGGPFPLSYYGLGDLFVILFFGFVSTCSAYYLQIGKIDINALLASIQIGLLATAIMAINNLRDIKSDAHVNKLTLAVRFGKIFARLEIALTTFLPFILGLFWIYFGYSFAALLPYLILPLAYQNVKAIWMVDPSPIYNEYFTRSGLIELLFGILLSIGFLLS